MNTPHRAGLRLRRIVTSGFCNLYEAASSVILSFRMASSTKPMLGMRVHSARRKSLLPSAVLRKTARLVITASPRLRSDFDWVTVGAAGNPI
jgi:hypothetical protein